MSSRTTWTVSQQQTNNSDGFKILVVLKARGSHCQPCLSGYRLIQLRHLTDVHQNLCRSSQSYSVAQVTNIRLVSPQTLLAAHPLRPMQPQVAFTGWGPVLPWGYPPGVGLIESWCAAQLKKNNNNKTTHKVGNNCPCEEIWVTLKPSCWGKGMIAHLSHTLTSAQARQVEPSVLRKRRELDRADVALRLSGIPRITAVCPALCSTALVPSQCTSEIPREFWKIDLRTPLQPALQRRKPLMFS